MIVGELSVLLLVSPCFELLERPFLKHNRVAVVVGAYLVEASTPVFPYNTLTYVRVLTASGWDVWPNYATQ